jgi:hypothetical protein
LIPSALLVTDDREYVVSTGIHPAEIFKMLLASNYDQARFFRAADLEAEVKLHIKTVAEELVVQQKKLVVWFTNDERGLILNKTANKVLREAFGDDCAGWAEKIIVLFPSTHNIRGEMVPSLRVRIPPTAGNGAMKPVEPEQPTPLTT